MAGRQPQVGEVWRRNDDQRLSPPYGATVLAVADEWIGYRVDGDKHPEWMKAEAFSRWFSPPVLFPQIPDEFWLRVGVSGPFENHAWDAPDLDVDIDDANRHAGWIRVKVIERRERQR
jgi:hypothetical protein